MANDRSANSVKPADTAGHFDSSSDRAGDDVDPVETLVAGRDRRATAGNRMGNLVELEQDDDVAQLFAEIEDEGDDEFEGSDEDLSDAQLDSSSDEDDHGPADQGDDELEGEDELQRQQKAERARKRRADLTLTSGAGLRKKVKIDPTLPSKAGATKPSKKKVRESFLPSEKDGPTKKSSRRQTVANREITHARIKEDAKKTAKIQEQLEKRKREREKSKPKELTQADRLAEAEKVERKNARSLNRWEETERRRAEEQAAKLAALHDRKLEGPVISSWSGVARWIGPRLVRIGAKETNQQPMTEIKKRGRKPKGYWDNLDTVVSADLEQVSTGAGTGTGTGTGTRDQTATPGPAETAMGTPMTAMAVTDPSAHHIQPSAPQAPQDFLSGIHDYASMPPESALDVNTVSGTIADGPLSIRVNSVEKDHVTTIQAQSSPIMEYSTRNLIILQDFEDLSGSQKDGFSFLYNNRKTSKPMKHIQALCPITSLPARYRDPSTGLEYANTLAYRKLQDLKQHCFTWSSMLGCFVGASGVVARGVPEGFL